MLLRNCTFETERLLVKEWHSLLACEWQPRELPPVVAAMLTDPVTRSLPSSWQGSYTLQRAGEWIQERDEEGPTLLAVDKLTGEAVGLMILFVDEPEAGGGTEVRLGYLVSEACWGKGLASEMVDGFVVWCHGQTSISSVAGGVPFDNPASRRVLEKNGFQLIQSEQGTNPEEDLYRLSINRRPCGAL